MAMTYGIREPEEELKTAGLKATAPRMKILEIFQRAQQNPEERHLSAEDVYKQLLKENLDVGVEEFVDREIERRQRQVAEKMGFTMESHSLSMYGICAECKAKEEEKAKKKAGL